MHSGHDTPRVTLVDREHVRPAGGTACLVSIYGPNLGRRWSFDADTLTIGRDSACDVVVAAETVSRRHCQLVRRGGSVFVSDLGSTNGTALNDQAVLPGDEIRSAPEIGCARAA